MNRSENNKWADKSEAEGIYEGNSHPFDHPFLQATGMFLGELSCLFVFFCVQCRQRNEPELMESFESRTTKFNWFVFLPASLCDMFATSIMYVGLNLTYASSFQMLRGAVVIFTALLSVAFLGRKIRGHMWLGMFFILSGLALVGISDIVFNDHANDDKNAIISGDLLIIMAQVITAAQMVYEEKVVGKYNVHPLKAVGLEGLFGFFVLGLLLIPMYFIIIGKPFTNDPQNRMENTLDAFYQLGQNWQILLATIGNIVSIAFFNFSGISVTKEMSATTRMVLDSCRTIIIWAVSLAVGWQPFSVRSFVTQLGGFFLLIVGMCLYNDIVIAPALRRCGCLKRRDESDLSPLITEDSHDPHDDPLLDSGDMSHGPITAVNNSPQRISNVVYS